MSVPGGRVARTSASDNEVFVLAAKRTPLGKLRGVFRAVQPHDLAATALRGVLPRASFDVDQVVLANAVNRGNIARVASLAAGLEPKVPGVTVNAQCSGGLTAVRIAAQAVWSGAAELVVAGGVESVSQASVLIGGHHARSSPSDRDLPRVSHVPAGFEDLDMGPSADMLAARLAITREQQDAWALESYRRTVEAQQAGFFAPLIAPVTLRGECVASDETVRRPPAAERLRRYPPAFSPGGTVTVGNAAAVADGAAAVLIGSRRASAALGGRPLARIVSAASAAADPAYPPLAVFPAVDEALRRAGLRPADVGRWEINEAFAVKIVACIGHLGLDPRLLNVNGGAIAYGHPFSASGAILLVHLVAEMARARVRYGVAAIAGAGGVAEALILDVKSTASSSSDDEAGA